MFFNKNEVEVDIELEDFSVEHLRKKLKSMKGTRASKKSIVFSILGTLPFFNNFMSSVEVAGSAVANMVQIKGHISHATEAAGKSFFIIGLVSSAIDFIRIPCIYVAAYIAGQESPITLSRNARFLYSAVLLGLAITAVAFPPSTPIIVLVSAIAALGLSVITLAKLYYKRYDIKDQLAQVGKEIVSKKNQINSLIDDLEELDAAAKKAKKEGLEYNFLENEIRSSRKAIKAELNTLQELCDSQERYKQKLEKLGTAAAWDKTVGIAFASFVLIGAIVSLVFPPVGFGILAATGCLAVGYVVGRFTYPLFKSLAKKIVNAVTKNPESKRKRDDEEENDELTESEFESSAMRVEHDMAKIKKAAKRLEQTIADYPIINPDVHSELPPQVPTPKISNSKQKKEDSISSAKYTYHRDKKCIN